MVFGWSQWQSSGNAISPRQGMEIEAEMQQVYKVVKTIVVRGKKVAQRCTYFPSSLSRPT